MLHSETRGLLTHRNPAGLLFQTRWTLSGYRTGLISSKIPLSLFPALIKERSDGAQLLDLASDETERFKDIMEAFIREQPSRTVLKEFDIRGRHSWVEVMSQLDLAKQSYEDKAKGRQGVVRRAGRWFSDNVDTIDPWVRLIPETDYSSVICGGLKFIFAVRDASPSPLQFYRHR